MIKDQLDEDRKYEFETNPIYQQNAAKDGGKGKEAVQETEKVKTPMEKGEEEDKRRKFLNEFRPCGLDDLRHKTPMHIWHFIEEENPTPHVLRVKADPTASYCDGRIQELQALIQDMGKQLSAFNKETWTTLNKYTWEIFRAEQKQREDRKNKGETEEL